MGHRHRDLDDRPDHAGGRGYPGQGARLGDTGSDLLTPRPAAVCVYGDMVAYAKDTLGDSEVKVAAVATAFPSGRASMPVKLADTRDAVAAGADEIDMVIDRGAFLSGDYLTVFHQIAQVKEACGSARLKVIMETGELNTYDNVRRASWLCMLAGGDFIKTSTAFARARMRSPSWSPSAKSPARTGSTIIGSDSEPPACSMT